MNNSQMKDFTGRLRRIDKINRKGGGFEADGTLGQSFYTRARLRRERRPLLRPALTVLLVIVVFKGFLLASIGPADYLAKVDALSTGNAVERAGGFVMAIDPLSRMVADWVSPLIG